MPERKVTFIPTDLTVNIRVIYKLYKSDIYNFILSLIFFCFVILLKFKNLIDCWLFLSVTGIV